MSQSLEKLLVAVVALMLLEPEVSVLVGLEVGLGPEAPPAQVAHVRFLLGVHAHVGLQRAGCNQKQNFFVLVRNCCLLPYLFFKSMKHLKSSDENTIDEVSKKKCRIFRKKIIISNIHASRNFICKGLCGNYMLL